MARGKRAAGPALPHRHRGHDRSRRPGTAECGAHRAGRGQAGHARRLPRPRRRRAPADPLRARQPGLQVQAHRPGNEVPPGANPEPGTAPGNLAGPDGPPCGRETPHGSPDGDAAARPCRAARPAGRGGRAGDGEDHGHYLAQRRPRRAGAASRMLDGYRPGDPWSASSPTRRPGRSAEEIADEAFDIFNDHPRDPDGVGLACAYYGRGLRSLSVGDIVSVGEVPLAVGRAGWTPVRGGLNVGPRRRARHLPATRVGRAPGRPAPRTRVRRAATPPG